MKKLITSLLFICTVLLAFAQEDVIRNGDFELATPGDTTIAGLPYWHMDKVSPESGVWGEAADRHVTIASDDSATLYQVVELISADSVRYDLSFSAGDAWNTGSVIVIISTSDADSTIRTPLVTDSLDIMTDEMALSVVFSQGTEHAGKHLIVEFGCTPEDPVEGSAYTNIDDVVMLKRLPGVNNPPIANAGDDQSAKGGELVTLDGSGSSDPDGDSLAFHWISTFPGITLSDPNAVNPTFTAPDVTELSSYDFALYVNDGQVNSDTVLTRVTVIPAGELIRNGDFSEKVPGSDPETESLKDVLHWNTDMPRDSLQGGIWGPMVTLASFDSTLYQVVDVIGPEAATYTLTMSARSSWDSYSVNTIFSVSEADSTVRTDLDVQENLNDIDPATGVNTCDYAKFKHVFGIEAGSVHAGKYLIVELDNIWHPDGEEFDDGWAEVNFVSLVKQVTSGIHTDRMAGITVYPNPASEILYIQGTDVTEIHIYSILGKLEKSIIRQNIQQVNVEDLTPGIYILKMTTQKGVLNSKIRIQ